MQRIKIRYNHWYPNRFGIEAITVYPYILFAGSKEDTDRDTIKHEMIHVEQIRRHGYWFYGKYVFKIVEDMVSLWRKRGEPVRDSFWAAYYENDFEEEACSRETEPFTPEEIEEIGPQVRKSLAKTLRARNVS